MRRMMKAGEAIPAGSPVKIVGLEDIAGWVVEVANTATEDVDGVAPNAIEAGRRGWVFIDGECRVAVDAGATPAADDPVTDAGLGVFGTAGTIIFGTYRGPKDANGLATVWLDDLASIGQAPGGGGLPDGVYIDEWGNTVFGAANIAAWMASSPGQPWLDNYIGHNVTFTPPGDGVMMVGCRFDNGNSDTPSVVDLSGITNATVFDSGEVDDGSFLANVRLQSSPAPGAFSATDGTGNIILLNAELPSTCALDAAEGTIDIRDSKITGDVSIVIPVGGDFAIVGSEIFGAIASTDAPTGSRLLNSRVSANNLAMDGTIEHSIITVEFDVVVGIGILVQRCTLQCNGFIADHNCVDVTVFDGSHFFATAGANTDTYKGFGLDTLVD